MFWDEHLSELLRLLFKLSHPISLSFIDLEHGHLQLCDLTFLPYKSIIEVIECPPIKFSCLFKLTAISISLFR